MLSIHSNSTKADLLCTYKTLADDECHMFILLQKEKTNKTVINISLSFI